MRYCLLLLLFFMPLQAFAQNAALPDSQQKSVLITGIVMEGFVPDDNKSEFVKLFKPYRNKHLTAADMDAILEKVKGVYEEGGYEQLVSITYQVEKRRLVFTALMIS